MHTTGTDLLPSEHDGCNGALVDAMAIARKVITDNHLDFIRYTYVCNDGVIRSKTRYVDPSATAELLPSHVGLAYAEQLVTALDDRIIAPPPFDPVGEVRLAPAWESLRVITHCGQHGRVFGPMVDGSGRPWSHCPRSFLTKISERARQAHLSFRIAFENEFYLLRSGTDLEPVDDAVYAQDDAFSQVADLMAMIAAALVAAGVTPQVLHPEAGPGQFEVSITPSSPLRAADDQVIVRSTVKGLAAARGLLATFLPRPLRHHPSSGSHINLSLWQEGENITGDGNCLSEVASAFVAGLLDHLPALVAITCPTVNSYHRLRPGMWSGAYRCWGRSNREAAIRVPYCAGGGVTHIEYRCADATCNPYLALGALLAAGMDGIERGLPLPAEVTRDPSRLSPQKQGCTGISLLPQRLDEALQRLSQDNYLRDAMGHDLHGSYLATRKAESRRLRRGITREALRVLARRF